MHVRGLVWVSVRSQWMMVTGRASCGSVGGVLTLIALQLSVELFPAGLGVGLVGGVGAVVQLEGLADGAKRVLN